MFRLPTMLPVYPDTISEFGIASSGFSPMYSSLHGGQMPNI